MALKGIELRHPVEDCAQVGIRWYSDGGVEPFLVATGKPLDIADVAVTARAGVEEVLLNVTLIAKAIEWVDVEAPVATFADEEGE